MNLGNTYPLMFPQIFGDKSGNDVSEYGCVSASMMNPQNQGFSGGAVPKPGSSKKGRTNPLNL